MKLRDFFENQKEDKLDDLKKNKINQKLWEDIEHNMFWRSFYKRFSFYGKLAVYTFFILIFFLSFYVSFVDYNKTYPEDRKRIVETGTGYLLEEEIERGKDKTSLAKAQDNIGKIIEAKGDFKIMQDGKSYETNKLYNGNTLILTKNTKLRFQVSSGVKAYIKGPAKLNIKKIGDNNERKKFVLNMIKGEYMEVQSDSSKEQNVLIKTDNFEVESKNFSEKMDLSITSQKDGKVLENKGGSVVVKKVIEDEKVYSDVEKNQKVKISEEIRYYREVKEISQKLKNKDISADYPISGNKTKTGKNEETIQQTGNINQTANLLTTKKVLNEEKSQKLKELLHPSFLMKDIEKIVENYMNGKRDSTNIAYKNFLSRISKIYAVFEFEAESQILSSKSKSGKISINDVFLIVDQLIGKIQNDYYLPEKYTQRLKTTLGWIVILKENEFGKFEGKELEISQIISKLNLQKYEKSLIIK